MKDFSSTGRVLLSISISVANRGGDKIRRIAKSWFFMKDSLMP
jgi:hypothetical protein